MRPEQTRTYDRTSSVVFLKTDAPFGGLSNMAGGFPLRVNGIRILTSEALYQACRFPHRPEVQALIIEQKSPMTAKMKSKPYRHDSRPDWDQVRVRIMRWCLRLKLAQNWRVFSELLLATGERPIVEESRKDEFWGAKATDDGTLVGMNVLGRLLMELREAVKAEGRESFMSVQPLAIPDFLLRARPIEIVTSQATEGDFKRGEVAVTPGRSDVEGRGSRQPSLFDAPVVRESAPAAYSPIHAKSVHIADLKPYAEYKESGLPWVGQVPGHWTIETLRRFLRSGDGIKIGPFGSQLKLAHMSESGFKVYGQANVIAGDIRRGSKYVDEAKFAQLRECEVRPGDLLVTMMGTSGRCMVVPEDAVPGLMDSHLLRLRLRSNGVGPAFTALSVDRAPYVKQQVEMAGKGSIMHGLNSGMVKNLALLIPPPDEQAAIVRFLDWANGRLERAIRAKRKVIALLNEQKQAIIHRAVTRGLDPSVPLKPSGIPWLGDIPEHWRIVRNMALFAHRVEAGVAGLPVLQVSLRSGITAEDLDQFGRPKRLIADPTKYKRIYTGDIAYNTMRMWQGAVGVSPSDGLVSPAYVVLSPRTGTCPDFYDFVFHTEIYKQQVNRQSTGIVSDRNRLYWDSFKQMENIAMPSSEQEVIVAFIRSETSGLNAARLRLEREIELLREYRTRLVADVVTGKLDVREAAARLPDEAPLDTTEDDADLNDEAEATDEEASIA